MVEMKDIYAAYLVARHNKRRSADSVEYELHIEANLRKLLDEINGRTLRPTAYTFITMKPRPREIFACEMGLRIVDHYMDIRLRPLLEKRFTDRSFNNRLGLGAKAAINQLATDIYEVSSGYTRDAYVIKIDLKGYFPNASQDRVYEQLRQVIEEDYEGEDKDDMLYMLMASVYSYPTKHCYRKSPLWKWNYMPSDKSVFTKPDGIGGCIGRLLWQNAMNYYLNDFDWWVINNICPHYVRFVDDMVFVVEDKDAFLPYLEDIRAKLAECGCRMHPTKFYCQHYMKGVEFIGSVIQGSRIYVASRTIRNTRKAITDLNRCARPQKLTEFLSSLNSYLGIYKTRDGLKRANAMMDEVSIKWWAYCSVDENTKAIKALPGYGYHDRIRRKFKLKYYKNGYKRRNRKAQKYA